MLWLVIHLFSQNQQNMKNEDGKLFSLALIWLVLGIEATEEVIKSTVDALNISRPIPFTELLARKRARARKRVKSCFLPEEIKASRPEEMEWVMVEESMCTSLLGPSEDSDRQDEDRRLNPELLSHLKERLRIDGSGGRSYISNPVIEQRLALKAQGLDSSTNDNLSPCFHRRKGELHAVNLAIHARWLGRKTDLSLSRFFWLWQVHAKCMQVLVNNNITETSSILEITFLTKIISHVKFYLELEHLTCEKDCFTCKIHICNFYFTYVFTCKLSCYVNVMWNLLSYMESEQFTCKNRFHMSSIWILFVSHVSLLFT